MAWVPLSPSGSILPQALTPFKAQVMSFSYNPIDLTKMSFVDIIKFRTQPLNSEEGLKGEPACLQIHRGAHLGSIVFLDVAEVGETITQLELCGTVESTKATSDIMSPVSGEVVTVGEDIRPCRIGRLDARRGVR